MRYKRRTPPSPLEVERKEVAENAATPHGGAAASARLDLPVSTLGGGLLAGVRLEASAELEDLMTGALRPSSNDDRAPRENPR